MKNFDTLDVVQQEFRAFYDSNLQDKYTQLEIIRKRLLKQFLITASLYVSIILLCIFMNVIAYYDFYPEIFSYVFTLFHGIFIYLCFKPLDKYKKQTKSSVMKIILSFWGDFQYKNEYDAVSKYMLERSEIFGFFDLCITDDAFFGEYKNTKISVSETELLLKGSRGAIGIFKGIVMDLELNKKFEGKTIVKNRNNIGFALKKNIKLAALYLLSAWMVISTILLIYMFVKFFEMTFENIMISVVLIAFDIYLFYMLHKEIKKKRLNIAKQYAYLEDVCFSKQWKVLTSNQIEARYVLTPVLMEKIKDIKKLFKGKYIDFSFFGNSLIFVIHTKKNMFETTSLFKPALNYTDIKDVVSQFYSIFSVIDILEGNNKKG